MLESPAHQRTLAGAPAVLRWQPVDGVGVAGDPGVTTVDVVDSAGAAVVTGQATVGAAEAERTYTLAAASNRFVDRLTVTWHSANLGDHTTVVDVVGGFLVTVAEARALESSLNNASKYPDAAIVTARLGVENKFEAICHQAFVPTLRSHTFRGRGQCRLVLDRPNLITVRSTDATGIDATTILPDEAGIAEADTCWPCDTFTVHWVNGMLAVPADVKRAAARYLRHLLNEPSTSGIPERAITWGSPELGGTATLATPGVREWHTAIPMVDETLEAHTWTPVLLA